MATKAKTHMIETQSGVSIENKLAKVGMIGIFTQAIAPAGVLYYNGATPLRADFPVLWQWAQDQGLVDNANAAKFGTGDNVTTFRLPDWRGAGIRMTGTNGTFTMANGAGYAGAALMVSQNDQMQGHRHNIGTSDNGGSASVTLSAAQAVGIGGLGGGGTTPLSLYVGNARSDGTNGLPRTGAETRMFNIAVNFGVYYE